MMRHESWSVERYRREMGLTKGVTAPRSPTTRKSIASLNKNEAAYAHYLEYEKMAGHISAWWPHPFKLKLPGWNSSYEPDFLIETSGTLIIVEIKTLWRNGQVGWKDDARIKFKTAAGIYTCFAWKVSWKEDECWQEERFA